MVLLQTALFLLILTVSSALAASAPPAADAKYFRSDAGLADSAAALPDNFEVPESLLWRVPLDPGHSTPLAHSGKIFLTTDQPDSKQLATVALEEGTGRLLWRNPLVPKQVEQTHPIGSPATATPACD